MKKPHVGHQTAQPVRRLKFESDALRKQVHDITVTPNGTVWWGQFSEQNFSRNEKEMFVHEAQKLKVRFKTKLLI